MSASAEGQADTGPIESAKLDYIGPSRKIPTNKCRICAAWTFNRVYCSKTCQGIAQWPKAFYGLKRWNEHHKRNSKLCDCGKVHLSARATHRLRKQAADRVVIDGVTVEAARRVIEMWERRCRAAS